MARRIPTFEEHVNDGRIGSCIVSAALDYLGYSYGAIKSRQHIFKLLPLKMQTGVGGCVAVIVGSKAEGLTTFIENDIDAMVTNDFVICIDDIAYICNDEAESPLLLLADTDNVAHGYTRLKFLIQGDVSDVKELFYKSSSGELYLSNVIFKAFITRGDPDIELYENGPALTQALKLPNKDLTVDAVFAIPYKCEGLMRQWIDRPRYFGWPDKNALEEISQLDWHVVAVGSTKEGKGTQEEWRICFTLGEEYLVKSFNATQLQLLILLKYIAKRILNPVCSAISSYIMKNIVLWVSEMLPRRLFKPHKLNKLLMMSLSILRRAVNDRMMKNYMIPARNMFRDKISTTEGSKMITILNSFLMDGPVFLLKEPQLHRLSEAMYKVYHDPEKSEQQKQQEDSEETRMLNDMLASHDNA